MSGEPSDPLFAQQWYLDHTKREGATADINVLPVWDEYSGRGVHVGVFDQAIDWQHPDLDDNYDPSLQRPEDGTGMPDGNYDVHGTPVAGIIAAERNGEGVVGIAYNATLTGINALDAFGHASVSQIAQAFAYLDRFDVANCSFAFTFPFAVSPLDPHNADFYANIENAADNGRDGLGTIVAGAARTIPPPPCPALHPTAS